MTRIIRRTRREAWERWIAALEGRVRQTKNKRYTQTEGYLNDGQGFCCLGVVCDLAHRDGGPDWTHTSYGIEPRFLGRHTDLPSVVLKFPGLSEVQQGKLIELNDSRKSFRFIAKYIRKEVMPKINMDEF